jgi:hypothetical protein
MKKTKIVSIIVIAFILASCSSTKQFTGVWINTEKIQGKSFKNIFILVMTADIQARVQLEKELAIAAESKGYKAVKSMDVMAPSLSDPKTPNKEDVLGKVKASGCDAVFVSSLLKKEEAMRYTPGTTAYTIRPNYSYYGNYFGYYSNWYPTITTPGYYTQEKSYFIESNLYDAQSEEIMWSAQSEVFDPTSLPKFSKSYTTTLMKQLEKENLLKK